MSINNKPRSDFKAIRSLFIGLILVIVASIAWDIYSLNIKPDKKGTNTAKPSVIGTDVKTCNIEDIDVENLIENFSANRKWVLIGSQFENGENILTITLDLNDKNIEQIPVNNWDVTYLIENTDVSGKLNRVENDFIAQIEANQLTAGNYNVKVVADFQCGSVETDLINFIASYPVYVTWTQDWEGTDVDNAYLNALDRISTEHDVPMTHFFNPRIYVTDAVTQQRAQFLTDWVIDRRDNDGDDIGLHLHMFPDMVTAAGVNPDPTVPRWGQNRDDGYDYIVAGYSESDLIKVLNWSKNIFVDNGLGDPVMFRAGGWYADLETLSALEKTGFVLDSSGRTKYVLGWNDLPGYWDLSSTTYPYQPSVNDQNSSVSPNMNIWEFPNNGSDSTNHKYEEMYQRFVDNYDGSPATEKRLVTFLSHPNYFYIDEAVISKLFTEIDKNLYRSDNGPVIYTTLSESYRIWTLPNEQ